MNWKFAVLLLMAVQVLVEVLFKRATDRLPSGKAVGVAYQFFFCTLWALLASFIIGKGIGSLDHLLLAAGIGVLNAYGNYSNWRAYAYSLSKTALFFPLSGIIAILLATVVLGERVILNPLALIGVVLSFAAMWLFQSPRADENPHHRRAWLWATVATVTIFGVTNFLIKPLPGQGVTLSEFLVGWYGGSLVGALTILPFERNKVFVLSRRSLKAITLLSLGFVVALGLFFLSFQYGGTVTHVIPLKGIALTVFSAMIGWFYFKERRTILAREWWAFGLGIVGAILILLR